MAVDPDVVPLLDAKADRTSVATLEARVAAIEAALPGLTTDAEYATALSQITALDARIDILEGGVVVPPPISPAGVSPRAVLPKQAGRKMWSQTKYGAILDAQGVTPYCLAHFDTVNPVLAMELHGFSIRNYRPTGVGHGMTGGEGMPGLLQEDCEFTGSGRTGTKLSNLHVIRRCWAHHNAEAGVSGGQAPNGMTIEDIDASDNNLAGGFTWRDAMGSAAGIKIVSSANVKIRRIAANRNLGPGVWLDFCDSGNEVDDVTAIGNDGPGVFVEISLTTVVRRPKVTGSQRWAGVFISCSTGVTVDDPDTTGLGVVISDDPGRPRVTQGPIRVNRSVHMPGTTPTSNGYQHGLQVQSTRTQLFTDGSVKFAGGKYKTIASLAFAKWNGAKTLAGWQAAGQELDGVLV